MLCNIKPVPITNLITTFLPKFQGGSGPPVPPSGSALVLHSGKVVYSYLGKLTPIGSCVLTVGKLNVFPEHSIVIKQQQQKPELLGSLQSLHLFFYVLARTYMALSCQNRRFLHNRYH